MSKAQRDQHPAPAPLPVGAILRRFRKEARLDMESLAAQANISESLLRKVESGHRPATRQTIDAVAPVLGISAPHAQQLMLLADPGRPPADANRRTPTPRELRLLDMNPFPACYMASPAWAKLVDGALHEVIATNAAFDRLFRGLGPGVNLLDYELLQPVAREVFVHWEEDAHQLVQACRQVLTTFVPESGISAVQSRLRQNPDFEGMWDTPFPALESRDTLWVRDLRSAAEFEMYFHVSRDASPWLLYTLTPADVPRYLKVYPPTRYLAPGS